MDQPDALEKPALEAARAALTKAHMAAPARDDYSVMLARALARSGDFSAARSVLGQVMARPAWPGSRDTALATMRQVIAAEEFAKRGANPAAALPPDRPHQEGPPASSVEQPAYRPTNDGEQRTEGVLERIECAPKRIAFLVRVADRVARFEATSFDGVDFITYRTDLQGSIPCGARQPPDRVFVTWRPGAQDGTVIAIEFLPVK
jgi:hypothetical protein